MTQVQPQQDDAAPGWDAITAVFERLHPGQKPWHWGSVMTSRVRLGGEEIIDGYSCYRGECTDGERYWHFVTYGMSELYVKESEAKDVSGFGIEFTFRLKCAEGEAEPPMWPIDFLGNLSRHVYRSGNVFAEGDRLPLNGPIALERETEIHAVIFAQDPEAGRIETPHGAVTFLQIVGVTADELSAVRKWDSSGMLGLLRKRSRLLVTDLERVSLLKDLQMAAEIEEGIRRDGSSSSGIRVAKLETQVAGESLRVTLEAGYVDIFQALLRGRTPFGRPCYVQARDMVVDFVPGGVVNWVRQSEHGYEVALTASIALWLAEVIRPIRGEYRLEGIPEFVVVVAPTQILDADGKVVEEIG
jgi:suppressor of fused